MTNSSFLRRFPEKVQETSLIISGFSIQELFKE
jgi:hypothetical protein